MKIALLCVSIIIMSRLMQLTSMEKLIFYLAFVLTYPFLLFSLMQEQYIFSVFWLFVFIHTVFYKKENQDYALVAATGSLLTSGAMLFFFGLSNGIRKFSSYCCRLGFIFLTFLCISGQFHKIRILHLFGYTGVNVDFISRMKQFINFITSCFMQPMIIVGKEIAFIHSRGEISYQLAPVESLNVLGLILLAFAITGFVLNKKNKFAQLCLFWIAFSFIILCLIGWGTAENGLILYTLYFGWAYFCLVFLAIEKLFDNFLIIRNAIFITAIIILAYINISGIYDLIRFGIRFYPV